MAAQAVETFRKRVAHTRQRARRARELERRRMRRAEQRAGTRGAAKPQDEVPRRTFLWCYTLISSLDCCKPPHGLKSKMLSAPPCRCFKRTHSRACSAPLVSLFFQFVLYPFHAA